MVLVFPASPNEAAGGVDEEEGDSEMKSTSSPLPPADPPTGDAESGNGSPPPTQNDGGGETDATANAGDSNGQTGRVTVTQFSILLNQG